MRSPKASTWSESPRCPVSLPSSTSARLPSESCFRKTTSTVFETSALGLPAMRPGVSGLANAGLANSGRAAGGSAACASGSRRKARSVYAMCLVDMGCFRGPSERQHVGDQRFLLRLRELRAQHQVEELHRVGQREQASV